MIGHLEDIYCKVLTLALLAKIIPNALKYICKSLQFWVYTWLFKKLLNRPNIIYFVVQIIKPGLEKKNHLVTPITSVLIISKTIIFFWEY